MIVGYLADAFDMINVRDLDLIAQANAHCSRLVVGVFTDEYAEEILGRRPVVPLSERIALVQHVRGVDEVVVHAFAGDGPKPDVPHLLLVPGDVPAAVPASAEVLMPRRQSESVQLRSALAAADREAVA